MSAQGSLMFRCIATGVQINSGFTADQTELLQLPPTAQIRLLCPACHERHDLRFVSGWIEHRSPPRRLAAPTFASRDRSA